MIQSAVVGGQEQSFRCEQGLGHWGTFQDPFQKISLGP